MGLGMKLSSAGLVIATIAATLAGAEGSIIAQKGIRLQHGLKGITSYAQRGVVRARREADWNGEVHPIAIMPPKSSARNKREADISPSKGFVGHVNRVRREAQGLDETPTAADISPDQTLEPTEAKVRATRSAGGADNSRAGLEQRGGGGGRGLQQRGGGGGGHGLLLQ